MTWVIGATAPFGGYGLMISDIRVTLDDGRQIDIIRKVHAEGPYLVLGFSGSVRLGFAMVESLRSHLALPPGAQPNACWKPSLVASSWHPIAAGIFAEADLIERKAGCSLLLVGIHPIENVACRMHEPTSFEWPSQIFVPAIVQGDSYLF